MLSQSSTAQPDDGDDRFAEKDVEFFSLITDQYPERSHDTPIIMKNKSETLLTVIDVETKPIFIRPLKGIDEARQMEENTPDVSNNSTNPKGYTFENNPEGTHSPAITKGDNTVKHSLQPSSSRSSPSPKGKGIQTSFSTPTGVGYSSSRIVSDRKGEEEESTSKARGKQQSLKKSGVSGTSILITFSVILCMLIQ
jgi:hypothetical protein